MQHSRSLCGSLAARPGLRTGALIKMLISADQDCLDSALIKMLIEMLIKIAWTVR